MTDGSPRSARYRVLLASALLLHCAEIDVCDRGWPKDGPLNTDTLGDQRVSSPSSLAAFPDGRWFLAFRSPQGVNKATEQTALFGAFLSLSGQLELGCNNQHNYQYVRATPTATQSVVSASVVAPAGDSLGLLVYVVFDSDTRSTQVFGQPITSNGCDVGNPFQISDEPTNRVCTPCASCPITDRLCISSVDATRVTHPGGDLVAVVWRAVEPTSLSEHSFLRVRIVSPDRTEPRFQRTTRSFDGAPVPLTARGERPVAFAIAPAGMNTFALTWQEDSSAFGFRTRVVLLSSELNASNIVDVHSGVAPDGETSVRLATHRDQSMLIGWTEAGSKLSSQVYARILNGDDFGDAGTMSPPAFTVSHGERGNEADPAVTLLASAKTQWMLSWTSQIGDAEGTGIRALMVDAAGRPAFCNRACDIQDFLMTRTVSGNQGRSAVVSSADGTIGAVYETSSLIPGRDGSEILGVVVPRRVLLPEQ